MKKSLNQLQRLGVKLPSEKIWTKKSLGQHWLINRGALGKIATAGNLSANDIVLEVGPGTGNLTELLLAQAGKVIAVEKDESLIKVLHDKFATEIKNHKLEIFSGDILTVSPEALGLTDQNYKVIANLPYYLTGEFLRLWLGRVPQPNLMVLLLQKEVVERIVAQPANRRKKESLLSLSVKVFGKPKMLGVVRAGSFAPAPAVDSAILLVENINRENLEGIDEEKFFAFLKKGFAHKRKLLQNNLGIKLENQKARAEDLKLEEWLNLFKKL